MKLSNLSLAILVAMGVAACGGSDDNNNQVTPPPGGNTPTPPPAVDNTKPQDPARVAPDMTVQPLVADLVQARKRTYADEGSRDLLTGYAPNPGVVSQGLNPNVFGTTWLPEATKDKDTKRASSMVNYIETNQVWHGLIGGLAGQNGVVKANPGFTYAEGKDGNWYRMQPVGGNWATATPNTKYEPMHDFGGDAAKKEAIFPGGTVKQDKLFYIPNVNEGSDAVGSAGAADKPVISGGNALYPTADGKPGGQLVIDPSPNSADFDLTRGKVAFTTAEFLGKQYDISQPGKIEVVDLNAIPVKKELQYLPVKINFNILDNKETDNYVDDAKIAKSAEAGAMKAYNLPYSLAFVTVNQKGAEKAHKTAGAEARNFFDYSDQAVAGAAKDGNWGAYQVRGYQTPFLPRNGRADYVGKSFGVDSQGDIHLRADFGIEGSHISGSVLNRTRADGKTALPEINLANIVLSKPSEYITTGTKGFGNAADAGTATSRTNTGKWEVQLFGPDAEEAGGTITIANDAIIPGGREVFTSQRGVLTTDSNIAPTP